MESSIYLAQSLVHASLGLGDRKLAQQLMFFAIPYNSRSSRGLEVALDSTFGLLCLMYFDPSQTLIQRSQTLNCVIRFNKLLNSKSQRISVLIQ